MNLCGKKKKESARNNFKLDKKPGISKLISACCYPTGHFRFKVSDKSTKSMWWIGSKSKAKTLEKSNTEIYH